MAKENIKRRLDFATVEKEKARYIQSITNYGSREDHNTSSDDYRSSDYSKEESNQKRR